MPRTPIDFFKCLGDETRLAILLTLLSEGELCVRDLTLALEETQPKVSRHLAHLRNCGLVTDRRQDQWIYYRIPETLPDWVRSMLTALAASETRTVAVARGRLAEMKKKRPGGAAAACD